MLGDHENLSTASVDHNDISVGVLHGQYPHILLDSKDFVKAFCRQEFIQEYNLPTALNHAMTGEA